MRPRGPWGYLIYDYRWQKNVREIKSVGTRVYTTNSRPVKCTTSLCLCIFTGQNKGKRGFLYTKKGSTLK